MNITYNKQRGSLMILLFLILIIIIFAGFIMYLIIHYHDAPGRDPNQEADDMVMTTDPAVVQQYFPNFQPEAQLLAPEEALTTTTATVERSTNLIDWADLYVIPPNEPLIINDTNPPWPQAFYRVRFDD